MLEKFTANFLRLAPDAKNQKYLIALSGGLDSVVLTHFFKLSGLQFSLVHCNFSLRGSESEDDEQFCRNLAGDLDSEIFIKKFNTSKFAEENGLSIQQAARELRYKFFHEVKVANSFEKICTAHHFNDSVETFFINLIRGSGPKGLSGIPEVTDDLVRPLLIFSREEIDHFAATNNLSYRRDSSNESEKYVRNSLRKNVLPLLYNIPGFGAGMESALNNLREADFLQDYFAENELGKFVESSETSVLINLDQLKSSHPGEFFLFLILRKFGFNRTTSDLAYNTQASGKEFYSPSHKAIVNRGTLDVIRINEETDELEFLISEKGIQSPVAISVQKVQGAVAEFRRDIVVCPVDKISFPLVLRRWKEGDRMQPFGMKTEKKLSDIFVDLKLSIQQKRKLWVLESNKGILWIVGIKASELTRIKDSDKEHFKISLLD